MEHFTGMYCTPNTSEEADCPPNTDLEGKDRKQSPTRDQMINIVDLVSNFHFKLQLLMLNDTLSRVRFSSLFLRLVLWVSVVVVDSRIF